MNAPPFRIDRRAVRRSFNRAATSYNQAAQLQATVRAELLSRLQYFKPEASVVLDLGAGTCLANAELRHRFPRARLISVDLALQLLQHAPRRWWRHPDRICADVNALPLADASVDLVFCNLMLQWCDELLPALSEVRRVLKPGGVFLFSSFGPPTLQELRAAWAAVDSHPHLSEFTALPQLAAVLAQAGFAEPVLDVETHLKFVATVRELAEQLRAIGARNAASNRSRALMSRAKLQTLNAAYESQRRAEGLPVSYEVIYGAAFASAASDHAAASRRSTTGETLVSATAITRRERPSS